MTPLSELILKDYLVRKTADQKTRFIALMQQHFPELTVEADKGGKNRNLILGHVSQAKILLTAHYDTCARMPFPNFVTPKNMAVYLGYSLLVTVPFFLLLFLVKALVQGLIPDPEAGRLAGFYIGYAAMMGAMYFLLIGGPANRFTANDNTSGIITLIEIYDALPEELRGQVAFVFFDNEESGLLGSKFFRKHHKQDGLEHKLLVNYDCVSDGDHMLFVLNKKALAAWEEAFRAAYPSTDEKTFLLESDKKAFYPSDQRGFPVNAAVSSMNMHKYFGLYMDKIHTDRDRCFDTRNIDYLRQGTLSLLRRLLDP